MQRNRRHALKKRDFQRLYDVEWTQASFHDGAQ